MQSASCTRLERFGGWTVGGWELEFGGWSLEFVPQTIPCGDGSFFKRIPGNKLPGYHHLVHSGQKPRAPVRKIDSTPNTLLEDEDEDEDENDKCGSIKVPFEEK